MERAGEQYDKSQKSLEQASLSLQQGTLVYQQSSTTIREMISDLRESHAMAIQRISQGVDESIVGVLKEAGEQIQQLMSEQSTSLLSWQSSIQTMQKMIKIWKLFPSIWRM